MASERAIHVDFALLLVLEFQENVGGFLLCPPFQNGWKMLGDKSETFRRLPFSLLLASNCFPRCFFCFLLPFVGWKMFRNRCQKQVLIARM